MHLHKEAKNFSRSRPPGACPGLSAALKPHRCDQRHRHQRRKPPHSYDSVGRYTQSVNGPGDKS